MVLSHPIVGIGGSNTFDGDDVPVTRLFLKRQCLTNKGSRFGLYFAGTPLRVNIASDVKRAK